MAIQLQPTTDKQGYLLYKNGTMFAALTPAELDELDLQIHALKQDEDRHRGDGGQHGNA